MAGIAGSVAPVFRGEYSADSTYDFYHSVTYGNKLYFCKQDGTKGHTPSGKTDDYWFMSIDGTFTDASSLGGETSAQWQSKLDSIQTTSRATLLQAGWYRVAEYPAATDGYAAHSCELIIKKAYSSHGGDFHHLRFVLLPTYKCEIQCLGSSTHLTQGVIKARHTVDATNNKSYLEIYYSLNSANQTTFIVENGNSFSLHWKAITPTLTSETVDGVTVTTTYDIPANAKPVNDIDLTTALAGYLKNTGGSISGSLILGSGEAESRYLTLANSVRNISLGIRADGSAYLYDNTNSTTIADLGLGGTYSWKGTSTGNLALDGGGTVNSQNRAVIKVNNTNELAGASTVGFQNGGALLGELGVDKVLGAFYRTSGGVNNALLHTGNSAKVVQSTSALSDTTAIWIDTANKVIKAYIDGAWTQVS